MANSSSQQFLRDLDKSRAERDRLPQAARRGGAEAPINRRSAADRLRANLDAAVYSRAERDSLPKAAQRVDAEASSNHAVLGLIFLKYVSDSFAARQAEIEAQLRDPKSDYFLNPADYGGEANADYLEAIRAELEERDYYIEKNVFWVPALARWKTLQDSAKLPPGTDIAVKNGKTPTYKITSTGKLIDDALDAVEKENPNRAERDRLPKAARRVRAAARINRKNVLDKRYTQLQLDPASRVERDRLPEAARRVSAAARINLSSLIDLIATIPFEHADLHAKDILGHVYEPSGARSTAEGCPKGWRGGANQYSTPKSIVSLIVEMLEPYQGRVYDPAMGSGGFFVQSERFIESRAERDRPPEAARRVSAAARINHGASLLSVYGQERNPTTWRLAAMNMAIRGIDFTARRGSASNQREAIPQSVSAAKDHFGKEPANSFTSDQHPDLRADYVMANPPFNISEWWDAKLEGDPRWRYGTPPRGNANFAWIQHMLHHLAPQGSMALLLANGSMSSGSGGECLREARFSKPEAKLHGLGRQRQIRQALIEADLVETASRGSALFKREASPQVVSAARDNMVALPGQLFTNTQIPARLWFWQKPKRPAGAPRWRLRPRSSSSRYSTPIAAASTTPASARSSGFENQMKRGNNGS